MVNVARMTHNVVNMSHNVANVSRIRHQGPCSSFPIEFLKVFYKKLFSKKMKKSHTLLHLIISYIYQR